MVLKKSPKSELVQTVEVPDQPTLEDIGGDPTKKMVEGLEKIQIQEDDDAERYLLIGEPLPNRKKGIWLLFWMNTLMFLHGLLRRCLG